jgi:hypothetical protein
MPDPLLLHLLRYRFGDDPTTDANGGPAPTGGGVSLYSAPRTDGFKKAAEAP